MSALQITRGKNGTLGYCANGCHGRNGLKSASDTITILGYPQGQFCPSCAKNLRDAWDNALTGWDHGETTERHVLRSAV